MIQGDPNNYGPLSDLVSGAGSLLAAVGALGLGWRRRAKWEPSEEDIARGPQRVGSLLAVIAIAILWSQTRNPIYLPELNRFAIILGIIAVVSLLIYGFLVATFTYFKVTGVSHNKPVEEKIIGGLRLTSAARHSINAAASASRFLTKQDLLAGAAYDPDKVWERWSRGIAKGLFVIFYLGLTVSGTIALACASIILGLSQ